MDRKILKAVVITGLLVLAVSAYAANTITLGHSAILNGKQLAAGEYQVKVSGSGDVTFLRGKTEVATAKARVEERGTKAPGDTVIVTHTKDGAAITEIQFAGKKQALVFDGATPASNDGSSGGRQ